MSIYDINYTIQSNSLLPPDKRLPKIKGWLIAFLNPLQFLRDNFFNDYADGFSGNAWDSVTTYAIGDKIKYLNKVYEATAPSTNVIPSTLIDWVLLQDIYIGLRERIKYNSKKIVLEFILNKWFEVAYSLPWQGANQVDQIYIVNHATTSSGFFMGETGQTSSVMAASSLNQSSFIGNTYIIGTNCFSILVPISVFNALDPDPTNAENIIRDIADKYVIAGIIYNVATY